MLPQKMDQMCAKIVEMERFSNSPVDALWRGGSPKAASRYQKYSTLGGNWSRAHRFLVGNVTSSCTNLQVHLQPKFVCFHF